MSLLFGLSVGVYDASQLFILRQLPFAGRSPSQDGILPLSGGRVKHFQARCEAACRLCAPLHPCNNLQNTHYTRSPQGSENGLLLMGGNDMAKATSGTISRNPIGPSKSRNAIRRSKRTPTVRWYRPWRARAGRRWAMPSSMRSNTAPMPVTSSWPEFRA